MILDLSVFEDETLDIRMGDGRVLHVRKPTERMVIEILRIRESEGTPEEILEKFDRLVLKILNSNTDGVTFAWEDVRALSRKAKIAVGRAYTRYIEELQANPISGSRKNPAGSLKFRMRNWFAACRRWRSTRG